MGLFNLLKNGLTIEKKKKEFIEEKEELIDTDVAEQTDEDTIEIEETPKDKKQMAQSILYGTANPTPTPPIVQPTAEPISTPVQQTFNAFSSVTSTFNNALLGQATATQNLLVISPKSPDEISAILSNLASGNACIVSLANITDAQRHLDYICGFMNAIGGTILQRTPIEYILTPKGVGIKS